jgi:hypothetical protein
MVRKLFRAFGELRFLNGIYCLCSDLTSKLLQSRSDTDAEFCCYLNAAEFIVLTDVKIWALFYVVSGRNAVHSTFSFVTCATSELF